MERPRTGDDDEARMLAFFAEIDDALGEWQASAAVGWSATVGPARDPRYAAVILRAGSIYAVAGIESDALGTDPAERRRLIVARLEAAVSGLSTTAER